jgi:phospholipid/cholesterol/gamma-HCH transport system permease protein
VKKKPGILMGLAKSLGEQTLALLKHIGGIASLIIDVAVNLPRPPYRIREIIHQMKVIGVETTPLVMVTMAVVGSSIVIELRYQLMKLIHTIDWVPGFAGIFFLREAGTAVVGAMVASRAGAGMAAEVGTMQITDQVDALKLLRTNPVHYLVVPRFIACTIMTMALSVIGVVCCIMVGYLFVMDSQNFLSYITVMRNFVGVRDFLVVFEKSFFYGMAIPIISCYYGFQAKGGAQGVGEATTQAVVYSILAVIFLDFMLTGATQVVSQI